VVAVLKACTATTRMAITSEGNQKDESETLEGLAKEITRNGKGCLKERVRASRNIYRTMEGFILIILQLPSGGKGRTTHLCIDSFCVHHA
jgi:hypothetical protein